MATTRNTDRATKRPSQRFKDPAVEAAFDAHPPAIRSKLMALRRLIFETAANIDGVGPLEETLRWKQPSYLTTESGSGTTIRIDRIKNTDRCALYFNCQTSLVETFCMLYPQDFSYGDNRSVGLRTDADFPEAALRHCIGVALTYHRSKPKPRK